MKITSKFSFSNTKKQQGKKRGISAATYRLNYSKKVASKIPQILFEPKKSEEQKKGSDAQLKKIILSEVDVYTII